MVQRNLVEGIVVHEVVQLTIIIQILHLLCFDVCLGEFIVGVERFFSCSTCQNIFVFCSYEGRAFAGLNVLEVQNYMGLTVHFKSNAFSKFTCRNHDISSSNYLSFL